MAKICNQLLLKDSLRDKKYPMTAKCSCCGEESNLNASFPFEMDLMINFLNDFIRLHKNKGCNKEQLPVPDWASSEVNLGFAV